MSNAPLETEKAKKILAERASQFAKEKTEFITYSHTALLVFNIGKQKYAIDFEAIERVIPNQKIVPIPGVNPLFSGLLYHNADIWPVVNLNILFNCKETNTESNFILLFDEAYRYAFSIGKVIGQIEHNKSTDLTCLPTEEKSSKTHIQGIYQTDIAVIDISSILNLLRTIHVMGINQ